MNHPFDELTKSLAQPVTPRVAPKQFGLGLAGMALAGLLALSPATTNAAAATSTVLDPAGDAVFPYDLYGAPPPPYLDMLEASVSYSEGIFHFEIKVAAHIPANADPGFTPGVNHLGPTFGILTDRKTAGSPFNFFGHTDVYHFNFLVGAQYSVADSGLGLELGWYGFVIDGSTFTAVEIPLEIRGDTFVFETSAASLGYPASFDWAVGAECDPVPSPAEKRKSVLMVDFLPDHGVANWSAANL